MCNPAVPYMIMAVSTAVRGVSAYQQGKFQEDVADYNAAQTRNEATQTRNKGVEAENRQRRATAELIAKQKAQAGASGVDVNSGSPLQLREDSELLGEADALRIRSNFENQATAMDDQADIIESEGKNAAKKGRNALFSSVLGSGAQVGMGLNAKWFSPESVGGGAHIPNL